MNINLKYDEVIKDYISLVSQKEKSWSTTKTI